MPEPKDNPGGLTEEAKEAIADAVRILREDGVHVHKTYQGFLKSLNEPKEPPKDGDPPPPKDPPADPPTPPAKRGLWWGDRNSDD
jgi:hypothetical protein